MGEQGCTSLPSPQPTFPPPHTREGGGTIEGCSTSPLAPGAALPALIYRPPLPPLLQSLAELLEMGAPFDLCDEFGVTPLVKSALNGHLGTTDLLLTAGADVNILIKVCLGVCLGRACTKDMSRPLVVHTFVISLPCDEGWKRRSGGGVPTDVQAT